MRPAITPWANATTAMPSPPTPVLRSLAIAAENEDDA
jgi:hypothetical protein